MTQPTIIIYCLILGLIIKTQQPLYISLFLLFGLCLLAIIPVSKYFKKQTILEGIKNQIAIIDINKAAWWELELIPDMTRVQAKKAVWIRKHNGFYTSKEDFYAKNNIKNFEKIDDYIYL